MGVEADVPIAGKYSLHRWRWNADDRGLDDPQPRNPVPMLSRINICDNPTEIVPDDVRRFDAEFVLEAALDPRPWSGFHIQSLVCRSDRNRESREQQPCKSWRGSG